MTADATSKTAAKTIWRLDVADEASTIALAEDLATLLVTGDVVTLSGDLGAGKTTFARALIRTIADDPILEAPSPTFTLMQIYEGDFGKIVHADFYRIQSAAEVSELGWEEVTETQFYWSSGRNGCVNCSWATISKFGSASPSRNGATRAS